MMALPGVLQVSLGRDYSGRSQVENLKIIKRKM
jgi:hypothetical protein